jgi:hypothetical protein
VALLDICAPQRDRLQWLLLYHSDFGLGNARDSEAVLVQGGSDDRLTWYVAAAARSTARDRCTCIRWCDGV